MATSVYDFDDYRIYLAERLAPRGETRGLRSKLALHLGCQTGFVSQVLKGHADFSLDHAYSTAGFLGLGGLDLDFFLLLVQREKSGSASLKRHFTEKLGEIHERRKLVSQRVSANHELSLQQQVRHYSSWHYSAIHVLLSISSLQSAVALARHLRLSQERVQSVLDHLVQSGLARSEGGIYQVGDARIHLGKDSPLIAKHHSNWRHRALQSIDEPTPEDLHYSLAMTLSKADVLRVQTEILAMIQRTEEIFRPSKEETGFALGIDFFRI